jgi:anti-anti-sigma factor
MPQFDVRVDDQGTTRTVTPVGELDLATVAAVRAPLRAGLTDGFEHMVLDLAETTFVDSTGVRLVLELSARADAGGTRFVLLPGPPAVRRVFELCGVPDIPAASPGD